MTGLWGVGQWEAAGGERVPWEISSDEIDRDIAAATAALRALGIESGERVLWCSMLSEAGQFWPFVVATIAVGAQLSCADATAAEAARVAMFLDRLPYDAVLGVTGSLLDGFDEIGVEYPALLGRAPIVAARPGAFARLAASGLAPHHFVLAGPAVGLGHEPGAPVRLAADEWVATEDAGHIAVTNRKPRANAFDSARTALRGRVEDGAIVPTDGRSQ